MVWLFQHFSSILFFHHFRIHFGIHFWSIFGPNPLQNLFKKPSKKYIIFCIDFSSIFNGFGTPFSSQVGPCWRQVGHLGASWGSFWRSWATSWLQGAPQAPPRAPRPPQTSISTDLGTIFGRIWVKFSMIFLEQRFQNRDRHGGGFARVAHWIIFSKKVSQIILFRLLNFTIVS